MNVRPAALAAAAAALVLAACAGTAGVATNAAARPPATPRSTSSTSTTVGTATTDPPTTTERTAATVATTSAPPIPDAGCDVAVDLVVSAAAARASGTAAEQLDAVGAAVDTARSRLDTAGVTTRSLLEQFVVYVDDWRTAGTAARARAQTTGDPVIEQLTDQLIIQVHGAVLNPLAFTSGFEGIDACPELRAIGTAADASGPDPMVDIRATRDELVARGHGSIAEAYLPQGWADLTDRDMTVALSGLQPDYDRCAVDPEAAAYGDNPGCDALYDACDARDLLACNDLYWVSTVTSEYEHFGATCGGRAPFGTPPAAGYCEQLG